MVHDIPGCHMLDGITDMPNAEEDWSVAGPSKGAEVVGECKYRTSIIDSAESWYPGQLVRTPLVTIGFEGCESGSLPIG